MKKLVLILVIALIGFAYSCEKDQDVTTTQNEFKKKPAGNNGNGNGNGNTMNLMAITGGDTIIMTPLSPIYVGVGDSVLLTITEGYECSWHNSHMQSATFYQPSWGETPFNFYDDQCWLIGLRAEPYPMYGWGLVTAGYTFPSGIRINTTNYYYVTE